MIGFAALCALCVAASPAFADVSYVDASLEFEGQLLSQSFAALKGGDVQSLCVALRLPGGLRELRIYALTERGMNPTPTHVVPVMEDVIACGFADVRAEAGLELVFLTRTGAYSYSLTHEGYRGNISRLVEQDLMYDVPDSHSLSSWLYMIPAKNGDLVLLPRNNGYSIFGPRNSSVERKPGEASYELMASFLAQPVSVEEKPEDSAPKTTVSLDNRGFGVSTRGGSSIVLEDDKQETEMLSDSKSNAAPALMDVNADGALDLVAAGDGELRIHLSSGGRIPSEPTRVEVFPEYLETGDADLSLEFAHLNDDELPDLIASIEEEIDGFENGEKRLLLLLNEGGTLLPKKPTQVLRFKAALIRHYVVDVNEDGLPDLVLRKFELPSMLGTVTGLEFKLTHMVYLAEKGSKGLLARRPAFKQTQVFNENTVGEALKNRKLEIDCNGDGIPDLVELDLQGRITIRRLKLESSFFSGDTWELDADPWKRFEVRDTALSIRVHDVNGDGLGDIVSPGEKSLNLYLSRRAD